MVSRLDVAVKSAVNHVTVDQVHNAVSQVTPAGRNDALVLVAEVVSAFVKPDEQAPPFLVKSFGGQPTRFDYGWLMCKRHLNHQPKKSVRISKH